MSDSDTSSYDSEEERFRARQAQYAELARIAAVSAAQRGTLHRIQAERAAREAVEAAAYSERLRQGRGPSHPSEDGCAFSNGAASSSRWGEDAAAGPVFPPSPAAPLRLVRMHEEAWALLSKRRLPVRFEDVPWPPCAPEAYVRAQLELELEQDWAQRRKGRAEGAAAVPKKIARRAWARLSLRWHPDSIARRVEIAEEDRPRVLQEAARVMAQLNQAREKLGQE